MCLNLEENYNGQIFNLKNCFAEGRIAKSITIYILNNAFYRVLGDDFSLKYYYF